MTTPEQADALARTAHHGQVDKAASPAEIPRGGCPVCGLSSLPLVHGRIQDHTTPAGLPAGKCAGSGRAPEERS